MSEFCGMSKVSFSMAVIASVSHYSQNVTKDKDEDPDCSELLDSQNVTKDKDGNPDCCELFGKKLVAAATYLIMPLIAIVEGIVRGFFAIFATLIALCISEDECRNWYNEHIFTPLAGGSVISFAMALSSLIAFGYNCKKELTKEQSMTPFRVLMDTCEAIGFKESGSVAKLGSMPGLCCSSDP